MTTPWTYDHEDVDLAGDLVPADFVCAYRKPGIFRTWRGVVGAISATGFVLACAYLAYCVFARVFTH